MLSINIINQSPHPLPEYKTTGAAGMDLVAWLPEPVTLQSLERLLIPTGLYIAIPEGYEAQIRPRSGMAINKGISMINAPGTIDSDYRGEIKIAVVNLSNEAQTINDGERIAQIIFTTVTQVEWQLVQKLENTDRGAGGFGHTGIK